MGHDVDSDKTDHEEPKPTKNGNFFRWSMFPPKVEGGGPDLWKHGGWALFAIVIAMGSVFTLLALARLLELGR